MLACWSWDSQWRMRNGHHFWLAGHNINAGKTSAATHCGLLCQVLISTVSPRPLINHGNSPNENEFVRVPWRSLRIKTYIFTSARFTALHMAIYCRENAFHTRGLLSGASFQNANLVSSILHLVNAFSQVSLSIITLLFCIHGHILGSFYRSLQQCWFQSWFYTTPLGY